MHDWILASFPISTQLALTHIANLNSSCSPVGVMVRHLVILALLRYFRVLQRLTLCAGAMIDYQGWSDQGFQNQTWSSHEVNMTSFTVFVAKSQPQSCVFESAFCDLNYGLDCAGQEILLYRQVRFSQRLQFEFQVDQLPFSHRLGFGYWAHQSTCCCEIVSFSVQNVASSMDPQLLYYDGQTRVQAIREEHQRVKT